MTGPPSVASFPVTARGPPATPAVVTASPASCTPTVPVTVPVADRFPVTVTATVPPAVTVPSSALAAVTVTPPGVLIPPSALKVFAAGRFAVTLALVTRPPRFTSPPPTVSGPPETAAVLMVAPARATLVLPDSAPVAVGLAGSSSLPPLEDTPATAIVVAVSFAFPVAVVFADAVIVPAVAVSVTRRRRTVRRGRRTEPDTAAVRGHPVGRREPAGHRRGHARGPGDRPARGSRPRP